MARRMSPDDLPPRGRAPRRRQRRDRPDEAALDEACFTAELRRSVEGARTPSEETLARSQSDWDERLGRICARYGR